MMIESNSRPKVSALLPIYNGETYLADAIDSVLSQTFIDFELIALNDGSADKSSEILDQYPNSQIQKLGHANIGLAATLNRGVAEAKGIYIARLDQDDLMLPKRLEKQVAFLDSNPEVALVGTWAHIYEYDEPSVRFHKHPTAHDAIKLALLFDNPIVHSSVMIRADVLRTIGGYSEDKARQPPEDYELWSRISREYKIANIPEVLTIYRESAGSMSRDTANPLLLKVIKISAENIYEMVKEKYDFEDCLSLSYLYHGVKRPPRKLSCTRAFAMLELAISNTGDYQKNASAEFKREAERLIRHIKTQCLRRYIPEPLFGVIKRVRSSLVRFSN